METVGLSHWKFKTPETRTLVDMMYLDDRMNKAFHDIVEECEPDAAARKMEEHVRKNVITGKKTELTEGIRNLIAHIADKVDWDDLYEALFDESVAEEHKYDPDYTEDGRRAM